MLQSSGDLVVTTEIMQSPQDFEEKEAVEISLSARMCYVTMALWTTFMKSQMVQMMEWKVHNKSVPNMRKLHF